MSHRFETVWNLGDYLSANHLNAKLHRRKQWLIALFAILAGVLVANPSGSNLDSFEGYLVLGVSILIGLVVCAIGFWISNKIVLPRKATTLFRQLKLDGVSTSFEFDSTGVRIAAPLGASNLEWSHITKWAEDKNVLMFYRTNLMFFAVPKAQINPDTLEELRQALIGGNVPKAG